MISVRPREEEVSEEKTKKAKRYYRDRNERVRRSFIAFRDGIETNKVDIRSLKLLTISGDVVERQGIKLTGGFTVTLTSNAGEMIFRVDDGVFVNGLWYFADRPISLLIGAERDLSRDLHPHLPFIGHRKRDRIMIGTFQILDRFDDGVTQGNTSRCYDYQ